MVGKNLLKRANWNQKPAVAVLQTESKSDDKDGEKRADGNVL